MKNIYLIPTDKPSRLVIDTIENKLSIQDILHEKTINVLPQNIYITSNEEIKEGDWFYSPFQNEERILKYNKFVIPFPKDKKIILTTDQDLIKDGVQAVNDEFLEWFVMNPSCEEVEIIKQHQYHSSKEFYIDADYVNCSEEQYESIKKEIPTCPLRILYKLIIPKEELNYNSKLEIEWLSNNQQCKQIESCYNSLSKKCICPKEEQKQHLIDMMQGDEELGLYDDSTRYAHNNFNMHETNNYQALKQGYEAGAIEMAKRRYSEEEVKKLIIDFLFEKGIGREVKNVEQWFEQFKKK